MRKTDIYPVRPLNKTKFAFTLAEVLITLGVIGVVAAMTIPTLIANYQKMTTVNKLKQTYSQILHAMKLVSEDFGGGSLDNWSCPGAEYYKSYGQSRCIYLTFEKIAGATIYPKVEDKNKVMCYAEGHPYKEYTYVNGAKIANNAHVFSTHGASVSLPNGACVHWTALYWSAEAGGSIVIDIDGPYSGRNRMGRDVFVFRYGESNNQVNPIKASDIQLWPAGFNTNNIGVVVPPQNRNDLIRGWQNCNKSQEGNSCTGLLVYDGWKISRDYPW